MSTSIPLKSDFFARALAAVAILGPILLVIIAGTLPEGTRGEMIVDGNIFVVAALVTALLLRVVYVMGFNNALENVRKRLSSTPNRSLTA